MLKKVLKKIFPLPAKKHQEIIADLYKKIDCLKEQFFVVEDKLNALSNNRKYKIQILSEMEQKQKLKEWYYTISNGKELNLENPKTFTDKINWLKIYDKNPMKSLLADKDPAPQYIDYYTKGAVKTFDFLGIWEDAYDIDFTILPQRFVLKCTHGSSWNIIVKDKAKIDVREVKTKLNNWLSMNYTEFGGCLEWNYGNIKPRIIAVEFMDDGHDSLLDYEIHCFNGEPKFIEIQTDHYECHPISVFFTPEWERLKIFREGLFDSDMDIPVPKTLLPMLNYSKQLSKDFVYVRIDFYSIKDEVYFGEFTFFPGGGYLGFKNPQTDFELGEILFLPIEKTSVKETR